MPDDFGRFIVGVKEQITERQVHNVNREMAEQVNEERDCVGGNRSIAAGAEMTTDSFQDFIKRYMQKGMQYRAGDIFRAYLAEYRIFDVRENVKNRKAFEMFLRSQTLKEDGYLKRAAHGVYEIRTDPNDRGISFPRTNSNKQKISTMTDLLLLYRSPKKKENSLEEILEDCLDLTANIKAVFKQLKMQDEMPNECRIELAKIENRLLESMDHAVTGVSAAMAWCEDYMDEEIQSETEGMTMGGM